MKQLTILLLFMPLLATLNGCKESDEPTLPPIVFDIISPTLSDAYAQGDTVVIEGKITCDVQMHGYEIDIFKPSEPDSILFNSHAHIDGNIYPIYKIWVNKLAEEGELILRFSILRNHETGEKVVKEMPIWCEGR